MTTPSVGRTVHYVSHGTPIQQDGSQAFKSECRAAIITGVYWLESPEEGSNELYPNLGTVDLCVLNPTGMFFNQRVDYSGDALPGTWHWPERV